MTDIIANFNRSALAYETLARPQALLAAELAQLVPPTERHGRALEFGAGPGLFTEQVQPWNGDYLATDAAAAMVQRGRIRCAAATWRQQDARTAAKVEPVDWLFACNLLQWFEHPETVLRSWRTTLRPGGHLVVAVLLRGTLGELSGVLPEVPPLIEKTATQWQALVSKAGFAVEASRSWDYVSVYPSALAFLRSMHAMGFAPRRLVGPGRLRAALRAYDQQYAGPGGVRATWQAWLARARVA